MEGMRMTVPLDDCSNDGDGDGDAVKNTWCDEMYAESIIFPCLWGIAMCMS